MKDCPACAWRADHLGQGLSVAIGAALAKKMNGDDRLVYTLHGDGELQEGQIWEAAMFAAGKKVDNLISTVDYNGRQIDGDVDDVLPLGDLNANGKPSAGMFWRRMATTWKPSLKTMADAKDRTGKRP
jgi:transketolase